jgi:hypothetical protein
MANGTLRWWRRKSAKKGKRLASRNPSNDVKVVRAECGDVGEDDEPELDQENDDDDEERGLDRDKEHFCRAWPMVIASGSVSSAWRMSAHERRDFETKPTHVRWPPAKVRRRRGRCGPSWA